MQAYHVPASSTVDAACMISQLRASLALPCGTAAVHASAVINLDCCCRALPLTGVMARTRAMAVAESKAQAARSRDISIRMHQEMQAAEAVAAVPA
jgi:hypothetical protein